MRTFTIDTRILLITPFIVVNPITYHHRFCSTNRETSRCWPSPQRNLWLRARSPCLTSMSPCCLLDLWRNPNQLLPGSKTPIMRTTRNPFRPLPLGHGDLLELETFVYWVISCGVTHFFCKCKSTPESIEGWSAFLTLYTLEQNAKVGLMINKMFCLGDNVVSFTLENLMTSFTKMFINIRDVQKEVDPIYLEFHKNTFGVKKIRLFP